ncbi:DUF3310 domain-containing protein [Corynebacterium pygosceleis]|uniref:DUF3310 domain-containing protein n=1 Tax=Corynebacterium pygosceleis TaxID=2800406 RepID=UPI002003C7B5|nr:DUF3310 domain-containing protein [Corynebacterium pygosceleis]MCK7676394.1 DUF3310 domain-containing protein [Corynebacterium pygosceleis]
MPDLVNHPPHYSSHPFLPGECIDYTAHMGFVRGNAFKYLWRAGSKDNTVQDLEKALWYIQWLSRGGCADPTDGFPDDETPAHKIKVFGTIPELTSGACVELLDPEWELSLDAAFSFAAEALALARKETNA